MASSYKLKDSCYSMTCHFLETGYTFIKLDLQLGHSAKLCWNLSCAVKRRGRGVLYAHTHDRAYWKRVSESSGDWSHRYFYNIFIAGKRTRVGAAPYSFPTGLTVPVDVYAEVVEHNIQYGFSCQFPCIYENVGEGEGWNARIRRPWTQSWPIAVDFNTLQQINELCAKITLMKINKSFWNMIIYVTDTNLTLCISIPKQCLS